MKIINYISEEVQRQGHDISKRDGLERVAWMIDAWNYAVAQEYNPLTIDMIELIGQKVEQEKNFNGFRKCAVFVGGEEKTHYSHIKEQLDIILKKHWKPLDFYRAFEEIHPFIDGNGRTGKILLNYWNHTLYNPIFPPNDFWGYPIRNP